jgi:hypothetical protein
VVWLAGKNFESMIQTNRFDRFPASATKRHSPPIRAENQMAAMRFTFGKTFGIAPAVQPTTRRDTPKASPPADNRHRRLTTQSTNLCYHTPQPLAIAYPESLRKDNH